MISVDADSIDPVELYGTFGIMSFHDSQQFKRLEQEKLKLQELMVRFCVLGFNHQYLFGVQYYARN
jgi:hypothetical protein